METQQKVMVGTVEKVNVFNEGRTIERGMGGELPPQIDSGLPFLNIVLNGSIINTYLFFCITTCILNKYGKVTEVEVFNHSGLL